MMYQKTEELLVQSTRDEIQSSGKEAVKLNSNRCKKEAGDLFRQPIKCKSVDKFSGEMVWTFSLIFCFLGEIKDGGDDIQSWREKKCEIIVSGNKIN